MNTNYQEWMESQQPGRRWRRAVALLLSGVWLMVSPLAAKAQSVDRIQPIEEEVMVVRQALVSTADARFQKRRPRPEGVQSAPLGDPDPEGLRAIKRQPDVPVGPQALFQDPLLAAAPRLNRNFEGLPFTGRIPADCTMAAGLAHVIVMVNSSFGIYSKSGTLLFEASFADWWQEVLTPGLKLPRANLFDPKVIYDRGSQRFVMVALGFNMETRESYLLISTSLSANPVGQWQLGLIDMTRDGATRTNNWADYPGLGLDTQAIYITTNQFSFAGQQTFQYAKLLVLRKSDLYLGNFFGLVYTNFRNGDGSTAFTLRPAITYGESLEEWMVNSRRDRGDFVTLWRISSPFTTPRVEGFTIPVAAYAAPPQSPQGGGGMPIESGDARLLGAVWRNDAVTTAHTVAGPGNVSVCRYLQISTLDGTVTLDASLVLPQGVFGYYPAVDVDVINRITTVFSRSSANEFVAIWYTRIDPRTSSVEVPAPLKLGEANYVNPDDQGRNRWGDYNGASFDPQAGSVWIYSMYAGRGNMWGTRVGEVAP